MMLNTAHQKYVEGVDVVIGYIEPHDRKENDGSGTWLGNNSNKANRV